MQSDEVGFGFSGAFRGAHLPFALEQITQSNQVGVPLED